MMLILSHVSSHRYILSISVADYTGQIWMQGFNDVGNIVFGMSANDLHELKVVFLFLLYFREDTDLIL